MQAGNAVLAGCKVDVLKTRISLGAAMLAAFFGILGLDCLFGTDIFIGCLALFVGSIGLLEFYKLVKNGGISPFKIPGLICGIILFISVWLSIRDGDVWTTRTLPLHSYMLNAGFLVALIFWAFIAQGLKGEISDVLKNISITVFGVLYVFFLLSFAMALRHLPGGNGLYAFLFVVLIAKVGDIGGYLFGRRFGRRKLFPIISPNKSVEGLISGLVLSVIIAWLLCCVTGIWIISWPWVTPFALVVSFSGMLGDLAESLIKRDANIKDAGAYIPTFGGALDVIDSLLVGMPVGYYFLVLVNRY